MLSVQAARATGLDKEPVVMSRIASFEARILEDAFTVEYDEYPFGIVKIPHRWKDGGDGE